MKYYKNILFIFILLTFGCSYFPDKLVESVERNNVFADIKVELVNRTKVCIKYEGTNISGDFEITVYRTENTNTPPQEIGKFNKGNNKYFDMNVTQGKTYYYRIKVINYKIETPEENKTFYSKYKAIRILTESEFADAFLPKNVVLSNYNNTVYATWDNVSNAQNYKIYRAPAGGGFQQIFTVNTNSFVDNPLQNGTYFYRVNPINIYGEELHNNNTYSINL